MPPTYGGAAAYPTEPISPEVPERFSDRARALFYARLAFLAIALAVLAVPSWSRFLGTTSSTAFLIYFVVIFYSVANFLWLEHPKYGRPLTFATLVFDLFAIAALVVPSGGLKSPVMAAHVMLTIFFVQLFPRFFAILPPFLMLPVVARLDLVFQEQVLFSEGLFLVVWYTTLSLIAAYVLLYLNERDERRSRQLSALSKSQEEAIISEERLRLAREMHDGLGGNLSQVIMQSEYIQRMARNDEKMLGEITELKSMAEEAIEELRRSLTMMRRDFDLHKVLDDHCAKLSERSEINTSFKVKGRVRRLPSEMQLTIFRILQESINNIQKHAKPKNVKARLKYDGDLISLTVADDGLGFDPAAKPKSGHYGLTNMEERAKKFRGTIEVQSAPGEGTTVHATLVIPLEGSHVAFLPDGLS